MKFVIFRIEIEVVGKYNTDLTHAMRLRVMKSESFLSDDAVKWLTKEMTNKSDPALEGYYKKQLSGAIQFVTSATVSMHQTYGNIGITRIE